MVLFACGDKNHRELRKVKVGTQVSYVMVLERADMGRCAAKWSLGFGVMIRLPGCSQLDAYLLVG
jgi:hypothetical protein